MFLLYHIISILSSLFSIYFLILIFFIFVLYVIFQRQQSFTNKNKTAIQNMARNELRPYPETLRG